LIPRDGLAIADNTATAQGVGGSITLHGIYDGSGNYTAFGGIEGQKENGTSGNYAGALVFKSRTNLGNLNEALRIDSSQRVGIGTTSPLAKLAVEYSVAGVGSEGVRLSDTTNSTVSLFGTTETSYSYAGVTGHNTIFYGARDIAICADNANNGQIKFATGGSEAFRVDSSRRLLVGTSSAAPSAGSWARYARLVSNGNTIDPTGAGILNLAVGTAAASIASGNSIGVISFADNGGNEFGLIGCFADATAGVGDYPGRLVFSTTADGASSPTERMRLNSSGQLLVGTSTGKDTFTVSNGISMVGGGAGNTLSYSGVDIRTWASSYLSSSGTQTLCRIKSPQGGFAGGGLVRVTTSYQYKAGNPGNNYAQYMVTTNTGAAANLIYSAGTHPSITIAVVGSGESAEQDVIVNYDGDAHIQVVVEVFGKVVSWGI
jgi:hypothetical protein